MKQHNQVGAIAVKEMRHIWRDKRSMLILFVLPALIVAIFGFVLSFEIRDVGVAVLLADKGPEARELVAKLDASDEFRVVSFLDHPDRIPEVLRLGNVKLVMIIPAGFGSFREPDSTLRLIIDGSYTRVATAVESAAKRIANQYWREKILYGRGVEVAAEPEVHFLYNPELKREAMPIPGLMMIIFLLVSSVMFSISMIRERENGTARLLMLAPLQSYRLVVGKAFPYLGIAIFHILSVWLLSYYLFGVTVAGTPLLFFFMCLLFALNAMVFGLLIAAWVNRQLEALIICWLFLFIPNVFLSGFIFPLQSMPDALSRFASLLPGTAFMDAYRGIVFRGTGMDMNLFSFLLLALPVIPVAGLAMLGLETRYSKR